MQYNLSYLRALEAESIHIMREVASEFQRPVMLYSIGKDSSVMLRLAQKAFHPEPIPFPLLHVDTSYKFEGDAVIVSSKSVPDPKVVRYAWQSNPAATLFNDAGLPASPFPPTIGLASRKVISPTDRFEADGAARPWPATLGSYGALVCIAEAGGFIGEWPMM